MNKCLALFCTMYITFSIQILCYGLEFQMKKDKSIVFQIYDHEHIQKDIVVSEFDYCKCAPL